MRIVDVVMDGSYNGSDINSYIDLIWITGFTNTVFITNNTSCIRGRTSYLLDHNWSGQFVYFTNCEAERASSDGFHIQGDGSGNFIHMVNCFACTCTGSGVNIVEPYNGSLEAVNLNACDNGAFGMLINASVAKCDVTNPCVGGNNRANLGAHGIALGADANNVNNVGGKCGGDANMQGSGQQVFGIEVNGSSKSNIGVQNVHCTGNNTGGIGQALGHSPGCSVMNNPGPNGLVINNA